MNAISAKILREQSVVLEEVTARNSFGPLWAFVLVRADKLETFRAQLSHGCQLADHGTILAKGSGDAPAGLRQAIMRDLGLAAKD
jgi:hypothetical protein